MARKGQRSVVADVGKNGKPKKGTKGKYVHYCLIRGCTKLYSRNEHLCRHEDNKHPERPIWCGICPTSYATMETWRDHRIAEHPAVLANESEDITFDPTPPGSPPGGSGGSTGASSRGPPTQASQYYQPGTNAASYNPSYAGTYGWGGASFHQAHSQSPTYFHDQQLYRFSPTGQNPYS